MEFENKELIETTILQILDAAPELTAFVMLLRGFVFSAPQQFHPYLELMITEWDEIGRLTGGRVKKEYRGQIRIWNKQTDFSDPNPASRIVTVQSYDTVQKLADSVTSILSRPENVRLGNLILTNPAGGIESFFITNGSYGLDQRPNTIDNGAILSFVCRTEEVI